MGVSCKGARYAKANTSINDSHIDLCMYTFIRTKPKGWRLILLELTQGC